MATVVWARQGGTPLSDGFNAVAMGSDGSSVLAGYFNMTDDGFTTRWTAIKLDANGTTLWTWQDEATGDSFDLIYAIDMDQDGSVALAGSGEHDFQVIKLDAAGEEMWRFKDGTDYVDYCDGIAMGEDGSVVAGGGTAEYWDTTDIPTVRSLDMAAFKLDAVGELVWKWQGGSPGLEAATDVAMADDGSVVMSGFSTGELMAVDDSGTDSTSYFEELEPNFAAVKLDSEGVEVWRWQDGSRGEGNLLSAVSMTEDGSFVLVGDTDGVWSGLASAGLRDFVAVKLDADGNEVWRWQGGTPGIDGLSAVAAQADGTIVLGGHTGGDWSGSTSGGFDFAIVALDTDGEEIWRWQDGSAALDDSSGGDYIMDISAGADGRIVSAGNTYGSYAATNVGGGDYAAVMLDAGALDTQSPTTSPPTTEPPGSPFAPIPAPSTAVLPNTLPSPTPALSDSTPILAGVISSVVAVIALVVVVCFIRKRRAASKPQASSIVPRPAVAVAKGNIAPPLEANAYPMLPSYSDMVEAAANDIGRGEGTEYPFPPEATTGGDRRGGARGINGGGGDGLVGNGQRYAVDGSAERALTVTTSTLNISTGELDEIVPAYERGGVASRASVADEPYPAFDDIVGSSSTGRRGSYDGLGLGHAVADAAMELARNCHVPGVSEAAAIVSILVNLVIDNRDTKSGTEASVRRCRSIVMMLRRAAKVLGKGGDTTGKAERAMVEDVHDAIFDLVQLIETYQSKNKLAQVFTSSLFRKRQAEMGAVVDRAILGLQLGLHVQVGNDVNAVKHDVGALKDNMLLHEALYKESIEEASSASLAELRAARRKRKLDQIEIPEDHVAITKELLGKGGFGEVFLADYNGRNAAAKVIYTSHDLGLRGDNDVLDRSKAGELKRQRENDQRKAFLRELEAMTRLRSPYTVNLYGAITCLPDRLVLVMELLAGGDLRTMLSNCERPLSEEKSRQIIGDICAGMAFLHSKKTVHGDVKSANVLLDGVGVGRAKIGDFGTSRWTQHTMSTGLATITTKSSKNTQMSLAWSAPEVLDDPGSTYASDVYSFGIVVWEVLSRKIPWASEVHLRDVYIRVVVKEQRPVIPDDAPTEIADLARACWAVAPSDRPTFSAVMEDMKSNGWNE